MVEWLKFCISNSGGMGSTPDPGNKIPHATQPKLNKKDIRGKTNCIKGQSLYAPFAPFQPHLHSDQRPLGTPVWGEIVIRSAVACPCGSAGTETNCNAGDLGSISGSGGSPGEGNSYPLQCSGLENSMDCRVHGVTKSQTWLSDFHFTSCPSVGNLPCPDSPHRISGK